MDVYPPSLSGSFPVPLDSFSYTDEACETFPLRYLAHTSFAAASPPASSPTPVFLYLGNEGPIESFYNASGGIFELAESLSAAVVFIEHRYYGESLPFGDDDSFTPSNLQYLTIEQALADYSLFISSLPSLLPPSDYLPPVIWGGSYGGMLAAWHRMKYPHLTLGAIASGAPIDFYPGSGVQAAFRDAFVASFEAAEEGCGDELEGLLVALEKVSDEDLLSSSIPFCSPAPSLAEKYAFYAKGAISSLAMINYPYPCSFISPLPAHPVTQGCQNIVLQPALSPLEKIQGLVNLYVNNTGDLTCLDVAAELVGRPSSLLGSTDLGVTSWNYQACTELILEPITSDGYGFYPPDDGKQTEDVIERCYDMFKVRARPDWMGLSFARGKDASRYLTNTVLMENSFDPWHVGTESIEENKANGLYKHYAEGGAHHQDLRFRSEEDSEGVLGARAFEREVITGWIRDFLVRT
jgi:pimeloyl-ACP methyl ester carboxylesterase